MVVLVEHSVAPLPAPSVVAVLRLGEVREASPLLDAVLGGGGQLERVEANGEVVARPPLLPRGRGVGDAGPGLLHPHQRIVTPLVAIETGKLVFVPEKRSFSKFPFKISGNEKFS